MGGVHGAAIALMYEGLSNAYQAWFMLQPENCTAEHKVLNSPSRLEPGDRIEFQLDITPHERVMPVEPFRLVPKCVIWVGFRDLFGYHVNTFHLSYENWGPELIAAFDDANKHIQHPKKTNHDLDESEVGSPT